MGMSRRTLVLGISVAGCVLLSGCGLLPCNAKKSVYVQPAVKLAPKPVKVMQRVEPCDALVVTQGGLVRGTLAMPTGSVASSAILVEKTAPAEVRVGDLYEYVIKLTNLTNCQLLDVIVVEQLPANFTLKETVPTASSVTDQRVEWLLGTLGAGEEKVLRVKGMATQSGDLTGCSAVTYTSKFCMTNKAVKPELQLAMTAAKEVLVCDEIPIRLVVSNTGTGTVRGVTVTQPLAAGLTTVPDGQKQKTFDAGDLAAGESREFTLTAKAGKTGQYAHKATAKSECGLSAEASAATVVRQPVLQLTKTGDAKQFVGRDLKYELTLRNTGDAAAENVVLVDTVPDGTTCVRASDDATIVGGQVTWRFAKLAANEAKTVKLALRGDRIAKVTNRATAQGVCADAVSAEASSEVAGIPAILLEVIDLEDPIEVGQEAVYVITATNQGSLPGTGIVIRCTLEENMAYVSSSGATIGTAEGTDKIVFAPLASLAPGAKAEWRVVVKAIKAGDVRFKLDMTSEQLSRPVTETEATNLY